MKSMVDYWCSFPKWKVPLARRIHSAVYVAAVGMDDDEIRAVVDDALSRARRDLSS